MSADIWLFLILCGVLLSIIPIGIFVTRRMPSWKGDIGEMIVAAQLAKLDTRQYRILHNILIPNGTQRTTQIDHVVVSPYGIFCIETKAHKGNIIGKHYDAQWTQVIGHSHTAIRNPLHQNYAHIKALEQLIASVCPTVKFHSIVVFTRVRELRVQSTSVCHVRDLVRMIMRHRDHVLHATEVAEIHRYLSLVNNTDRTMRDAHRASVRAKSA